MNCRNVRQALIVCIQGRCDRGQPRHQPVAIRTNVFQQLFDRGAFADNKAPVAPFDQQCAADQQAIFRTSEPEIVRANLAQTPKRVHHVPSLF